MDTEEWTPVVVVDECHFFQSVPRYHFEIMNQLGVEYNIDWVHCFLRCEGDLKTNGFRRQTDASEEWYIYQDLVVG